jgi:Chain length determinant protein
VNTTPTSTSLADEISLRDVFLVLKRWWWLTLFLPLLLALAAFIIGSTLPKVYSSRGLLNLTTLKVEPNQILENGDSDRRSLFANLPLSNALAQGFEDSLLDKLSSADPKTTLQTEFDELRNLLVIKVDASSANESSQKVTQGLKDAQSYFRQQITQAILSNATATIAQTERELRASKQTLAQLGQTISNPNTNTSSAALESNGVDPQIARSDNPGATYIRLEEAKLQTEIARAQAKIKALDDLRPGSQSLDRTVDLYLRAQVLALPSQNAKQTEPRPILYAIIALILGLLTGIILPFTLETIQSQDLPSENIPC